MKKTILLLLVFVSMVLGGCASTLHRVLQKDDPEAARKLIEQGADVNAKWHGMTPLHFAGCKEDIAELLIAKGADVNAKTVTGDTPLHWATLGCGKNNEPDLNFAKLLLAKGANPAIRNNAGETPRMRAEKKGQAEIVRLLKEAEEEGPRRVEVAASDLQEDARFTKAVQDYQNTAVKPTLPEEARRYKVQAEEMVREKRFEDAAELYGKALKIAPWWPEGHFNRAIVLGENRYYQGAIREMKRYLTLVPNAPDARAAQDKIYAWEIKAGN